MSFIINSYRYASSFDADATAYINAVISAGGSLTTDERNRINTFFVTGKSQGWYSDLKVAYLMRGGVASAHKFNAVNPLDTDAAFRGIFGGGWTHNASGATGNGTTGYLEVPLVPSTGLTANSTAWLYDSGTSGQYNTIEIGVSVPSGLNPRIAVSTNYLGISNSDMYSYTTGRVLVADNNGLGVYGASRTASNIHKFFHNGTQIGTTNTGSPDSMASLTERLHIQCYRYGTTRGYFSPRRCRAAIIANSGLSDTKMSQISAALIALNSDR